MAGISFIICAALAGGCDLDRLGLVARPTVRSRPREVDAGPASMAGTGGIPVLLEDFLGAVRGDGPSDDEDVVFLAVAVGDSSSFLGFLLEGGRLDKSL